ncbi:DUF559 domain-containing protein [Virgisporangium aliadipatigenens]|uniref:DUF559 domain-containing protein n=1 Tax=Virgisporangium aliadipatigenens TaxID=741659 RepID=UPI001EF3B02D|nr:DUF559 domain-containing protein [Virgisporangium aliadipatigenens]
MILGSRAVAAGHVTLARLKGPHYVRLFPDVYAPADLPLDHAAWCRAAALLLDGRGALSGYSAALLWGVDVLPRDAPVEVTVPRKVQLARRPNLVVVRSTLAAGDIRRSQGLPVTHPDRTAFDLARRADVHEGVVAVDALLNARRISHESLRAYALTRRRWPRAPQLAEVLALADAGAQSPMETRTRLMLLAGGLPRPTTQYEVRDAAGTFVARLDLAYKHYKVGVEYEGAHHRDGDQYQRDLRRINALHALGWLIIRFGPGDILHTPERSVALVRAALAERV